jgi:hypothetical protein
MFVLLCQIMHCLKSGSAGRDAFAKVLGGGFEEFIPESWDYTLGNWMEAALQK